MSVSWRNPRRRRSLDKKSGSPDHQSEMEANDDKTERSPPQVTTHSQATEQTDLMSLCVWESNPSNYPRIILIWSWQIGIYILIFIPSRRPQAIFKPIVLKMFPFLSEIACNGFWPLLVEICNAFHVVCGEVQFSRGCWWRGGIFKRLLVDFLNVGGGEGATAVSSLGKGGSPGLGSSGTTS